MSGGEPDITRRKLYEMVWKEPVEDVAKRLGLSGLGLGKLCERQSIPVPPRGYWQKKAAGRIREPRPPLIELPGEAFGRLDLHLKAATDHSARQMLHQAEEAPRSSFVDIFEHELAAGRVVKIPKSLMSLHPIVERWTTEHGRSSWTLTRTEPLTARTFRIYSALLTASGAIGFRASSGEQTRWSCRVSYRSVEMSFSIKERIRQFRRPLTDEERRKETWGAGKWRQIREPTGELILKLETDHGSRLPEGVPNTWSDGAGAPLEGKLPEVLAAMVAGIAFAEHRAAIERERWVEAERQRKLAEERRRERERSEQRKVALQIDAKAWREAVDLRAYVAAVKAEIEAGRPVVLPLPPEDWITWSLAVADEIDPLKRKGE